MRGRKPKTAKQHRLAGNPSRLSEAELNAREGVQAPKGDVDPPAWLTAYAVEEWDYYYPLVDDMGLMTLADRGVLALMCQHLADFRLYTERLEECRDPERGGSRAGDLMETDSGYQAPNPYVAMANRASAAAIK